MKNVPGGKKVVATLCSSFFASIILMVYGTWGEKPGPELIVSFIIFFFYAGIIILVYGSYVSYVLEFLFKKWGKHTNLSLLMYVLFHGLFGSLVGIIFNAVDFIIIGSLAAIVYGIVDVWTGLKYQQKQEIH
jgi:hypothetical protein